MLLMGGRKIEWLCTRPYAHRGLHDFSVRPENSLPALRWAVDEGFGVEIDVRVLSDREVVLFHDEDMVRMTGVAGAIEKKTLPEVSSLRLGEVGDKIPTLAAALDVVDARIPILIDLKNECGSAENVSAVFEVLRDYPGPFAIISRSASSLSWLRTHAPEVFRGLVFDFDDEPTVPGNFELLYRLHQARKTTQPDLVLFDLQLLSPWRAWMIKACKPLVVWTVTTTQQWQWAQMNTSNFIFELSEQMPLARLEDNVDRIGNEAYETGSVCGRISGEAS